MADRHPARRGTWLRTQVATAAGSPDVPSEDRALVGSNLLVVLDGATVRTETGCVHGVGWYADHLSSAIVDNASLGPTAALGAAIRQTSDRHRDTCDLSHPGTPSAAVAVVQVSAGRLRYLVLGDVTIALDLGDERVVVTDDRVSRTAITERAAVDALASGSPEKAAALVRMKRAELAARNVPGGYWIAANDPGAADHAVTGDVNLAHLRRAAILTDGAARAVDLFKLYDWGGVLDVLEADGSAALINRVRDVEATDQAGVRWPRNKLSDDATVVYCAA